MKVKVFMLTGGLNRERTVLQSMHDGIKDKLEPDNKREFKEWKRLNKEIGRGAGVEYSYDEKYSSCDLAVMFGSWKRDRDNLHHNIRNSIVDKSKAFICIETPLLGRKITNEHQYYRVGVNGFLNRAAQWGEELEYPSDRLNRLGYEYKGWKKDRGDKIVIAMQLAGDASLRGNDMTQWTMDTIWNLRKYTDRPIEIRTHPATSGKGWEQDFNRLLLYINFQGYKDVTLVNGKDVHWETQIKNAYCVVSYTSGLSIDAVASGIPVLACDEGNFAWNVGERKITNIESLNLADESYVHQWLRNLAYCQWTPEEMESGECWDHLSRSVERALKENERESN